MIVTITLIHFPTSFLADNEPYLTCEAPFNCGNLVNLSYPFWGSNRPNYCGHPSFQLDCGSNVPQMNIVEISNAKPSLKALTLPSNGQFLISGTELQNQRLVLANDIVLFIRLKGGPNDVVQLNHIRGTSGSCTWREKQLDQLRVGSSLPGA